MNLDLKIIAVKSIKNTDDKFVSNPSVVLTRNRIFETEAPHFYHYA